MTARTLAVICCAGSMLAGCGGRNAAPLPNVAENVLNPAASTQTATLTVVVRVPRGGNRSPRYISVASKGMTISLKGPEKRQQVFGLTHPSERHSCKDATTVTTCTFGLELRTGSYTANVAMFDRPPANGHIPATAKLLSIAGQVPFTMKAGKNNRLKFKPEGVVASLEISDLPHGTVGVPFSPAKRFTVTATDADGYIIVGPYKHPVTLADSDRSGATTIATSGNDNPPTHKLLSSRDIATLDYTGSAIVPATITANCTGAITGVGLFVLNEKALFIANSGNNTVTEYAPPYTGAPAVTISNSVSFPGGLASDASGSLFVVNAGSNTITEYAPPYTGAPTATISRGLSEPFGPAFDANGNLFVANFGNTTVTEYAPPYTGAPTTTISKSVNEPFGVALDASGNLFVANYGNSTITEYAPPYTGAPTTTISSGVTFPYSVALDASGNLFVGNANDTITELAPPYTGVFATPISTGLNKPFSLAFDASGRLFVANQTGNDVTEYTPPSFGALAATISNSVSLRSGWPLVPELLPRYRVDVVPKRNPDERARDLQAKLPAVPIVSGTHKLERHLLAHGPKVLVRIEWHSTVLEPPLKCSGCKRRPVVVYYSYHVEVAAKRSTFSCLWFFALIHNFGAIGLLPLRRNV